MHTSARSYLTAGVALVGASAIALTPVHPVGQDLAQATPRVVSDLAVGLAAAVDPITALFDALNNTVDSVGVLGVNWASGLYVGGTLPFPPNTFPNGNLGNRTGGYATGVPLPILTQIYFNALTYLRSVPDFGFIFESIFGNIGNALTVAFEPGVELDGRVAGLIETDALNQNVNGTPYITVPALGEVSQREVGGLLPTLAGDAYESLKPILDFASTPISGLLVGALGPIVAPVLSIVNSVEAIFAAFDESDFLGAVYELINIPTNAINAFLNGGPTLDLTGLVGLLGVELPEAIESIGLKMGGLLSPGGVAFDALAVEAGIPEVLSLSVPGLPVGPLGALASLSNYVSNAIKVPQPPIEQNIAAAAEAAPAPAAAIESAIESDSETAPEVAAEAPAVVADEPAEDAPAPAPKRGRSAAGSDNSGNDTAKRVSGRGAAKSASARGAD